LSRFMSGTQEAIRPAVQQLSRERRDAASGRLVEAAPGRLECCPGDPDEDKATVYRGVSAEGHIIGTVEDVTGDATTWLSSTHLKISPQITPAAKGSL
jgi:hypothetical protein